MNEAARGEVQVWRPDDAGMCLRQQGPWDWLITSNRELDEERAGWCPAQLPDVARMEIHRSDPGRPHRFVITSPTRKEDGLDWSRMGTWLAEEIYSGQRVLVDMDLLAFDVLLYLLPALQELELSALGCLYIAPQDYIFSEKALSDQLMHPIEQPKAYVALALDADRKEARHLVFLGFDLARAWKFIASYDWDYDHLFVAVGEPAFVPNGRERAIQAAMPWVADFQRDYPIHLHEIPAHDPDEVADWCARHWQDCQWLDIVPIGPKPMNLGILWFYFGLQKHERGRVRLLYDFPIQQASRSRGIGKVYFYNCARLLR